ncbi:Methyltransferase domain-containing protein [Fontimonas thermophila]|uniref:Methyltransferase domain-containing protein n=1 Tax=Fontimonas thermophila TaxID=1076937 RepID=A0A1I2JY57_9GAMM|nr:methyltransferase domain-containing protein [Fontimonas thermophila]SFF57761.1 Methyltransferase domain-containing protein [Fontimonas thermophila]
MTTTSTQWQLARDAAQRYEQILVPTILGPAARALVEFAALQAGEAVLDVGCGTGAAARCAAEKVGPAGRVAAVDVNAGMIDVGQLLPPVAGAPIEWVVKTAYELPFAEAAFTVVLCAQTLQFLDDRPRALAEMYRVLRPGGRVALSLWCEIQESPYFDALVQAVTRHIGAETAVGLRAAFGLSELATIRALVEGAGYTDLRITVKQLDLRLPRLSDFVPRHVSATPMAGGFSAASPEKQQAVVEDVSKKLASYDSGNGVCVPFRTYLVQAVK